MELKEIIQQYRLILTQKLMRGQERRTFVEVVMILLVGILWGLYNPNQVAEQLGINPKQLYARLKELSAGAWRRLLDQMMMGAALERLRDYQAQSAATQSRRQASLSIDDTVVKRLGSVLSYVWCWYSGQAKKVVKGQDLVGIVLRIGGIIPLRLVWVSKQGRGCTSKPEVVLKALAEVKEWFAQHGVDLTVGEF